MNGIKQPLRSQHAYHGRDIMIKAHYSLIILHLSLIIKGSPQIHLYRIHKPPHILCAHFFLYSIFVIIMFNKTYIRSKKKGICDNHVDSHRIFPCVLHPDLLTESLL